MEKSDWHHPELESGEVLLRNMNSEEFSRLDFSTKRQGKNSYDGDGNSTSNSDWFPVFIKEDELRRKGLSLGDARESVRNF